MLCFATAFRRNSVAIRKEIWVIIVKLLTRCLYNRGSCSLKPKLRLRPITSINEKKKKSTIKIASHTCTPLYLQFQAIIKTERHLGKFHYLSNILSIGVTTIAALYILDTVTMLNNDVCFGKGGGEWISSNNPGRILFDLADKF